MFVRTVVLFFVGMVAYPQVVPKQEVEKLPFKLRAEWYLKRTYTSPRSYVSLLGEVTFDDFTSGGLKKWETGKLSAWELSLASAYGQRVVSNTTELFVGAAIGDDARYTVSSERGVMRRSWYAAGHAFTARTESGKTRIAYSRLIAVTVGALIANRWRPHPEARGTLAFTVISDVTGKVGDDFLAEFGPDLRRFGKKTWGRIHH